MNKYTDGIIPNPVKKSAALKLKLPVSVTRTYPDAKFIPAGTRFIVSFTGGDISKDPIMFTEIKRWINKIREAETSFKILDLRGCNFSIQEKEDLTQEATSLNLLI